MHFKKFSTSEHCEQVAPFIQGLLVHSLLSATENIAVSNDAQTTSVYKNHYQRLCHQEYYLTVCYFEEKQQYTWHGYNSHYSCKGNIEVGPNSA